MNKESREEYLQSIVECVTKEWIELFSKKIRKYEDLKNSESLNIIVASTSTTISILLSRYRDIISCSIEDKKTRDDFNKYMNEQLEPMLKKLHNNIVFLYNHSIKEQSTEKH